MAATARAVTELYVQRLGALTAPGGPVYVRMLRTMAQIDARSKFYLNGVMVHKRTGNLLSSQQPPVILQHGQNVLGVLQNIAAYSVPVHEGTRPHEIRAVNAKTLRFQPSVRNSAAGTGGGRSIAGNFVYPKAVKHPGPSRGRGYGAQWKT